MSNSKYVRYIGIDFGTSTSVVSYMDYETQASGELKALYAEPLPVKFDEDYTTIPTVIQMPGRQWSPVKKEYVELTDMSFGRDAVSKLISHPDLVKQNFKINLISEDEEKREEARKLLTAFFKKLYEAYKEQRRFSGGNGAVEEHTYVSYPAKWNEEASKLMVEVASKAGFSNVKGIDESIAAMMYCLTTDTEEVKEIKNRGIFMEDASLNILLIDMGAGTTDLAIYKYKPKSGSMGEAEMLATYSPVGDAATFGGSEIDEILTRYIQGYLEKNLFKQPLSYNKLRDLCVDWKEKVISPEFQEGNKVDDLPSDLIYVISYLMKEDSERFEGLNRVRFEELLNEYLQVFPDMLNKVIEKASLKGEDVDIVIVTGGHSQWYFVNEILLGKRVSGTHGEAEVIMKKIIEEPWRIVTTPYPQQVVSQGLSMAGKRMDFKKKESSINISVQREVKEDEERSLSKEPVFSAKAHEKCITTITFSKDGKLLATGAGDRCIKIWDTTNKVGVRTLDTGSYNPPYKILFLQDDRYVLAHLYNDSKVWKASNGMFSLNKTIGLAGHLGYTTYSPKLNSIAYHSSDKVKFCRLPDYTKTKEINVPVSWLSSLRGITISSDGGYLIAAVDKEIRVYGTVTGSLINTWKHSLDSVRSMAAYNNVLIFVDCNGKIKKWSLPGGVEVGEYKNERLVEKVSISPSFKYCAIAYERGAALELIRLSDMKLLKGTEHIKNVYGVAFSADENYLATGHRNGSFNVWSILA